MTFKFAFSLKKGVMLGLALLSSVSILIACSGASVDESADSTNEDSEEIATNSEEIENLQGQDVVFYADFEEKISQSIFRVREDGTLDVGDMLVVNDSQRSLNVPEDNSVPMWIYGEVQPLTAEVLEENAVPLDVFEDYEGQLAVFAEDITLAPDPALLVDEKEAFYDQPVTVYGEVEFVEAEGTFILKNPGLFGGEGVVVIMGAEANDIGLADGENAVVTGILRPYIIADLKEDYDLTWSVEFQDKVDAVYEQSAVLIADQIYPDNDLPQD